MSIKNILVGLAPRGDSDPAGNFAISMAAAFKAHVAGRVYVLDPEVPVGAFDGLPADVLQSYRAGAAKEAEAAAKKFEEAARRAKVQVTHTVARATPGSAAAAFGRQARIYDLSILAQSAKGLEHVGDLFAEAALFHSGRPVIVVPKRKQADFSCDRVLIAWDGGPHATRAVAAAMPVLALAKKLEVLVIGNKALVQESQARDLVRNLERHGFDAELICRDGDDIPQAIATEAKTWSASLLVMGGYGRSRLTEWIFGGVTRYMLSNPPLPVLMAH